MLAMFGNVRNGEYNTLNISIFIFLLKIILVPCEAFQISFNKAKATQIAKIYQRHDPNEIVIYEI